MPDEGCGMRAKTIALVCDVTGLLIKSMTRIERFPLRRGTATGQRRGSRAQGDGPAAYRVEVSKHPGIRTNIPHPR